jgi:Protein of unknown function (DUF3306)
MVDEDNFLRRWSRRKHESARQQPAAEPAPARAEKPGPQAAPAPAAVPASQPQPPELPPVESLQGLASDYKEFLNPAVGEDVRRAALKKLFHDPHFNVMDGLDVYIDDYSKPDPIPESMLKELLARHLEFPAPEEQPEQGEADARLAEGPRAEPEPPAPEAAAPAADVAGEEAAARPEQAKRG